MISYITSFFSYIFGKNGEADDDDDERVEFLAEQLVNLNFTEPVYYDKTPEITEIPKTANCFQRTGVITYLDNDHILIDGSLYFCLESCTISLRLNDKVLYLGYRDENESIIVVRILECYGTHWGDDNNEDAEENSYKIIEHIIIGEVEARQDRWVYMKDNDLKFNLDDVTASMVPIKGDWLELKCNVQWDENKPHDIAAAQVLKILSIKPLRSRVKCVTVTEWSGEIGTCDRQIYFNKHCIQDGSEPKIGSKVHVEAIESNQGLCVWRAIKLITIHQNNEFNIIPKNDETNFTLENELNIEVTPILKFDNLDINETGIINLNITNNNNQYYIINKLILLSSRRDSQVDIQPMLARPKKLFPKQTFSFTITCLPKFLGNTREQLIIMFRGFQIKRFIEINIVNKIVSNHNTTNFVNAKSDHDKIQSMKRIRNCENSFVPGVKTIKPAAFIPVRIGQFNIPQKIWSAVLGDSEQTIYTSEYDKIISRIESLLPCLSQNSTIGNYIDRWHTLLYIEEIQANINIRVYDISKVFLIRCQEYLGLEIKGLSEKRPSLIQGDRVMVKDVWDTDASKYEGYIHVVKGDMVLIKFHQQFHESYNGSDVSVEFYFNRITYRRAHQAVNLALSNLGVDVLFPSRVLSRPPQLKNDIIENIKWYNTVLNKEQKLAISNILLAECRPLPYIIYGPPGTGKTVTVIEAILQILCLLPDSRILVATPSNSAANLVTERLIQYSNEISGSIIRLLALHLVNSDSLPENIKPFCATLDIARENTVKSRHVVENGINLNCQASFIGRHRVTIGTCYTIGSLAQMGLPKGHFTHIIIDEAGQATEPEIMIPMTFTDKENGQIILAGDPMQLGPVIMSKYCKEFGMSESYLSRILETFPYQKDFDAYETGFNNKLVTRLIDNYRSLKEVLTLPSAMFYDASLVEKIDGTQSWIKKMLEVVSEIFDSNENTGGIHVYGIKGCNARAEDSPSWYNPQEASMLALTVCKLYKNNVKPSDIGVIAPYIAQIKYIRMLFDAMGLPEAKIGTVEEFQGQERPIILISTVRSSEAHLNEDQRNTLGFVKNPKRLNVAITRAQVAVFLFCDPTLLMRDPLWQRVIKYAVDNDHYMGCDIPYKRKPDSP